LAFLLDGLHEDLNLVTERVYVEAKDPAPGTPHNVIARQAWADHKKRNDSLIVDLFQGQFRSTLMCLTCRNVSVSFTSFMYLTLPLPRTTGGGRVDLADCLKLFSKAEKVSGSDQWYCSRCKMHRDAAKKIEIWKLPAVLIVHFNRFSYSGQWRQKMETHVNYPLRDLDLSPFVLSGDGGGPYTLHGVACHFGGMDGGHYTSMAKNVFDGQWHLFDDARVTTVSSELDVRTRAAYVLFYSRVDFRDYSKHMLE